MSLKGALSRCQEPSLCVHKDSWMGKRCRLRFMISAFTIWDEACPYIHPPPLKPLFPFVASSFKTTVHQPQQKHVQRRRRTRFFLHVGKCQRQTLIDSLEIYGEWWPRCDIHTGAGTHAGFARCKKEMEEADMFMGRPYLVLSLWKCKEIV